MTPYELAPWLGEHESPIQSLQRGVSAGSQLTTNFFQGMRERQNQEEFQMMAPLHYQQAEQQVKQQALQIATQQNMLNLQTQTRAGQAMFSGALSKIAEDGNWANPEARKAVFDVGSAHPEIIGTPAWMNAMDNFEKSDAANLKAKSLQNQLDLRNAELDISKDRETLAREKADKGPLAVQLLDQIDNENNLADLQKQAGNSAEEKRHRDRAQALREAMPGTEQQSVTTGYDDQGRPIVTVGKGKGIGSTGGATVGTASIAQQKLTKYENARQLLSGLEKTLKPTDVGAAGVGGEFLLDRTMAQIPGFEGAASKGRIANRTALGVVKESLMREISDDTRFSNKDREDIGKMLPSSGIFESYPDAMQRLQTVSQIINDRSRNWAERIGEPVPLFAQTREELSQNYKKQANSYEAAVQAGNLSREDADKQIAATYQKYLDAMVKFH